MTAINVVVQSRAVHLLTDGAALHEDGSGRLTMIGNKVFPMPHMKVAVAVRGTRGSAYFVGTRIEMLGGGYDELRGGAADLLRGFDERDNPALANPAFDHRVQVVVAGLSTAAGAPAAFVISNYSDELCSGEPYSAIDIPQYAITPYSEDIADDYLRSFSASTHPDDFDLVRDGLAIMEAQRRPLPMPRYQNNVVGVGGFVQLTTVSAAGTSMRVIRRWPDEIGKPITA